MWSCVLIALLAGGRSLANPLAAQPAVHRLPTGAITPSGWLLRQLVLQAEGLSGHLTKFWPRVRDSAWFGDSVPSYLRNNSCGAAPCPMNITQSELLHQEAPYWLNGFVPLAYLLRNAGIEQLPPRGPGLPTIRPLEQARRYVHYVLDHNGSLPCGASGPCAPPPPGWLGPYDIGLAGAMYWGSFPALLALQQFAEAERGTSAFDRASLAMVQHLLAMQRQMKVGPSFCQVCPSSRPCWGPAFPLPSNGSCKVGVDLCGGDISRDGIVLPAGALPTACESACRQHNVALQRGEKACEAYVFAKGNASRSSVGPTCYLKTAPGAFLPQGKCGNGSFWSNGTMANFCAASLPLLDTCRNMSSVRRGAPTGSISFQRWIDLAYSIIWLLNTEGAAHGHEPELRALLSEVAAQGQRWDRHFQGPIGGTHNVNLAQGLKSAAINFLRSDGSPASAELFAGLSRDRMARLDANFGLPTGMYVGDEHLPPIPDRNPGRGIETCGVVESMFSYTTMYAVHGDPRFADRAEKIAFNALPATWFSPLGGGEMWAHQYFQAVNELNAVFIPGFHGIPSPVYTYGINNFPCCTANFHQGWPKFANAVFHTNRTADYEGIVVSLWAPASATTQYGNITVTTEYPFGDNATIVVTTARGNTSLYLRVPGWASQARIQVGGRSIQPKNGTVARLSLPIGTSTVYMIFNAQVRLETDGLVGSYDGQRGTLSYSVHRGPILYSLNLEPHWKRTAHYYGGDVYGSNDYSVTTSTPWAFALDPHPLKFVFNGYPNGAPPFNRTQWVAHVEAMARPLVPNAWPLDKAKWLPTLPPASPACAKAGQCGASQPVKLVPHGGTALRVGTMPLSEIV